MTDFWFNLQKYQNSFLSFIKICILSLNWKYQSMINAGCGVDISYFDQGKIWSDTIFWKRIRKGYMMKYFWSWNTNSILLSYVSISNSLNIISNITENIKNNSIAENRNESNRKIKKKNNLSLSVKRIAFFSLNDFGHWYWSVNPCIFSQLRGSQTISL